ncbi:hypothetical protein Tco_1228860 [Tanacetum coccineum]
MKKWRKNQLRMIRKKWKGIVEIKDTPPTTIPISPRIRADSLSSDKEELKDLTAFEPTSSSLTPKPKTSRSKHIKGAIARISRRYGLIFQHMKKSFMPMKDMDAISETVQETLKEVVPLMVDEATNDSMKKNLPKIVVEGISLEQEKVKADIASTVDEVVKKEHESKRAEISTQVSNDVANNVPSHVDSFLQNYMNNHILYVHPTEFVSSTIPNLQQLYLKMKDDEQTLDVDLPIWLTLMYKYEKFVPHVGPCRVDTVRTYDHEDHHDGDARPERESSVKRQRHTQEQLEDFDPWFDDQGIDNDDEVPSKQVSPELLAEVSGKGTTADDLKRMQDALNDMMRSRCDSGEEHRYHLDQMKSYMESQTV